MKLQIKKGVTSKLLRVFIQDSSVTTGAGLTGLLYNSAGLTAYYIREGAATATAITLATMTVGTWATGGFKEVDATNMPGLYEIGIPNAVIASGADSVVVLLKGAANMVPVALEIQLIGVDLNDAVRLGMTALPNAAAGAAGGLPTSSAGKTSFNDITVANILNATQASYIAAGSIGESLALGSAALADTTATGTPTSTTIPLTAGNATNDFYKDQLIYILSGTGVGQVRPISSYNGTTKTVTVDEAFEITPVAGDRVAIIVTHVHAISSIGAQVMADLDANGSTVIDGIATDTGTTLPGILGSPAGATMSADIAAVKTDSAAIKTKTDSLTFTKANELDANVQSVNDVTIVGDGSATPFNV